MSTPIAVAANRREEFLARYPAYASTGGIDALRRHDFARLDREGHAYLDYTGGALYAESQIRRHAEFLLANVLGNPHSSNPSSAASTSRIELCRERILRFFGASREEYAVVLTANATQALKLVGESYPFEPGDQFLLTFDNHNSVNGIREFDRAHGAETTYVPVAPPELRVEDATLEEFLARARPNRHNLFAYPAQSNFSGVQHPLDWIELAHRRGWDVLLDAAAFVPTNRLALGRLRPDFVALSFYKIFGFPTGVGALLARRSALAKLHRPWFAGGTIGVAFVQPNVHTVARGEAGFEDGTLDYLNIPAVELGLDLIESIGIETIHERVRALTGWLLDGIGALCHSNGRRLLALYGPASTERRGGTVSMNFFDPQGRFIDHRLVERLANRRRISLRTGCFCNPGAGEAALGLSRTEIDTCYLRSGSTMTYDDLRRCLDDKSTGAVRVSLGLASNFEDVERFLDFSRTFLDVEDPESLT